MRSFAIRRASVVELEFKGLESESTESSSSIPSNQHKSIGRFSYRTACQRSIDSDHIEAVSHDRYQLQVVLIACSVPHQ